MAGEQSTSTFTGFTSLPTLGSSYTSINEFKLALYAVCRNAHLLFRCQQPENSLQIASLVARSTVKNSVNLAITSSAVDHVELRCSLGGSRRPVDELCSCTIACRRDWGEECKVVRVEQVHSCGLEKEEVYRAVARAKCRARIRKIEEEMRGGGSASSVKGKGKQREVESDEKEESEESGHEESGGGSCSDEDAAYTPMREVRDSRERQEDVAVKPRWTTFYPTAQSLWMEIAELASVSSPFISCISLFLRRRTLIQAGPVPFPSSTDTFSTARDLLIHAYAAVKQRGYTIFRASERAKENKARMVCSNGHARFRSREGGRCGFRFKIEEKRGRWSVSDGIWEHNHVVLDGGGTKVEPTSRKRGRNEESGSSDGSDEDEDKTSNGGDSGLVHPPLSEIQFQIHQLAAVRCDDFVVHLSLAHVDPHASPVHSSFLPPPTSFPLSLIRPSGSTPRRPLSNEDIRSSFTRPASPMPRSAKAPPSPSPAVMLIPGSGTGKEGSAALTSSSQRATTGGGGALLRSRNTRMHSTKGSPLRRMRSVSVWTTSTTSRRFDQSSRNLPPASLPALMIARQSRPTLVVRTPSPTLRRQTRVQPPSKAVSPSRPRPSTRTLASARLLSSTLVLFPLLSLPSLPSSLLPMPHFSLP
jgi:hypothetical protein